MKGLSITIPGVSIDTIATSLSLPVADGLLEAGIFNDANKGKNLTGSPKQQTYVGEMQFDGIGAAPADRSSGVNTNVPISGDRTILVAVEIPSVVNSPLIPIVGTWSSPNSELGQGLGVGMLATGTVGSAPIKLTLVSSTQPSSGGNNIRANLDFNNFFSAGWAFLALKITPVTTKARNLTKGTTAELTYQSNYITDYRIPQNIHIAKSVTPAGTEQVGVKSAFCFIYDRELTQTEVDDMYAWAKKYMSNKGLSI